MTHKKRAFVERRKLILLVDFRRRRVAFLRRWPLVDSCTVVICNVIAEVHSGQPGYYVDNSGACGKVDVVGPLEVVPCVDSPSDGGLTFRRMRVNSHLRRAWSKVTNTRFLTLLIAIGTLATAFVAYRTANDSHEQVQLLARQVAFNSSETRPFLRLKPDISAGKLLRVDLDVRSQAQSQHG